MKPFLRFLLRFIIGVVSAAALLVLLFWLFIVATGVVKYPRLGVEYKFHRYERSFETVYQFIEDFDPTPYENGEESSWHLFIEPNNDENANKSYSIYCSDYHENLPVEIDDESVTNALDVLFDQANIAYIRQSEKSEGEKIFFAVKEYAGVIYSKSGETPTETIPGYNFFFKPMNGNWFLWECDDD